MTGASRRHEATELRRQREFVRRLAEQLLGDAARADDIAQETIRRVLEKPPRVSTPAWFATVARRLAFRELRTERRRARHESAVPEPIPPADPAQLVAELEWSCELSEAVRALDEPARRVVLWRYWREWSVARIAEAEGRSPRAIEMRLQRARRQLRRVLERRSGESREAWVLGLGGILVAQRGASPWCWGTACLGAMSMKTVGVLGVVVVAALVLLNFPAEESAPNSTTGAEAAEVGRIEGEPRLGAERAPLPPDLSEEAQGSVPAGAGPLDPEPTRRELDTWRETTPPGVLAGIVLRGRRPVSEGGVVRIMVGGSFGALRRPWEEEAEVQVTTLDDEGRFRFEGLETGSYVVGVSAGRHGQRELWCDVDARESGRSLVVVLGEARLFGTIYGDEGGGQAGAVVKLGIKTAVGSDDFHLFQVADARGQYEFAGLPGGGYWFTVEPGGSYEYWLAEGARTRVLDVEAGQELRHDHGRAQGLSRIAGRLVGSDGRSVRGPGSLLLRPETGGYSTLPFDEEGAFELRVGAGRYDIQPSLPSGKLDSLTGVEIRSGMDRLELVLPGCRVVGQVYHPEGRELPLRHGLRLSLRREGATRGGRTLQVGEDGRFVFDAVPAGKWTFLGFPWVVPEGTPESRLELREGETERVVRVPLVVPD